MAIPAERMAAIEACFSKKVATRDGGKCFGHTMERAEPLSWPGVSVSCSCGRNLIISDGAIAEAISNG